MAYDSTGLSLLGGGYKPSMFESATGGMNLGTGSLNTAPAASGGFGSFMSNYGAPIMGAIGAISSGIGAYFSAESQKSQLQFQSDMAALNAKAAENTAQSILQAGSREASNLSMRAGKVVSSQKAGQGARGVQIGVGSAAEEVATTNLMKETDMLTINANAVRAAGAARMQSTNYANQSLLQGTSASSINPYASMGSSLMTGAAQVAPQWYKALKAGGVF